ncbi:hypothetical protein V6N12_069033 [Hibiscus sabdariffa]|uniref:RNase H type-1 domain-containing protein n=1 Tax=Hibiscus sabdariffa TaxID=183260 RepID=A0ABR2FCR3_9ROSI
MELPSPSSIKVNMDGAFDTAHGVAIIVLACDDYGRVPEGLAQHSPSFSEVNLVQIATLVVGLQPASKKGWTHVILEFDSMLVVNKLSHQPHADL